MTATVHADGPRTVVALEGDADESTRLGLCRVLSGVISVPSGDVVIDLTQTTFVGAAAGRILATAAQLLGDQERKLTFRSPT